MRWWAVCRGAQRRMGATSSKLPPTSARSRPAPSRGPSGPAPCSLDAGRLDGEEDTQQARDGGEGRGALVRGQPRDRQQAERHVE